MTTWAKLTQSASLSVARTWAVPADYWGQTDIWIPANGLAEAEAAFFTGALFAVIGTDSVNLAWDGSQWTLENAHGGVSSGPFTADTTHTIKFHIIPTDTSTGTITWYLDDVNVGSYSYAMGVGGLALGPGGTYGQCCESFFYTNVRAGSTENGHDLFASSFYEGGGPSLAPWTVNAFGGSQAITVDAPSDPPCATLTITPKDAQPGDTITLTGTGYTPGSPLTLFIGNTWISSFTEVADGSGNFTVTMPMPPGPITTDGGTGDTVVVYDENAISGCFQFLGVCGGRTSDGWRTDVNPALATGGVEFNAIFDYIFHDGAHWILWRDPSTGSAATGTFPPPANHALNATRISADGSSVVDYPIDTGYQYDIAKPPNAESNLSQQTTCCCPTCGSCDLPIDCIDPRCIHATGQSQYCIKANKIFWFQDWAKPVYDARFASDGTTLWVGVLTKEHIPDPWTTQSVFDMSDASVLVSDRTTASTIGNYNPRYRLTQGFLDFCRDTAFPVDDGGDAQTGNWDPPRVRMFAGGEGGFNLIGIMDAKFCPGTHDGPDACAFPGVQQTTQRGSFFSGISMAASAAQPGVCHLVWSEGGDWGTYGEACLDNCGCPHHAVWDAGPFNRDYRVGYSTWTPSAKAAEYDLWHSHIDRQNGSACAGNTGFYFTYNLNPCGYTWPPMADFAAASAFQVVNDTGTPILFISFLETAQNPGNVPNDSHGAPFLDYGVIGSEATVRMYDISGGTATALQVITPDLIPTEEEAAYYYNGTGVGAPYAPDSVNGPTAYTEIGSGIGANLQGIIDRAIGVSLIYDDPLASPAGTPVYLVRVPWSRWDPPNQFDGTTSFDGNYPLQAFYRVPVDGSGSFEFLDGTRQVDFSIVKDAPGFRGDRFFSDPRNIWIPAPATYDGLGATPWNGFIGEWFDRVCVNQWEPFNASILEVPDGLYSPGNPAVCPGFSYDPDADIIYWCAQDLGPNLFQVNIGPVCRHCLNCQCGKGVHIARRV